MALFREWLYRPHVSKWYEDPSAWLAEAEGRDGEYRWIRHFIAEQDGRPVGFCQYYEYAKSGEDWHGDDDVRGAYSIDYLIGEADCLGKGLGKQIVQALKENVGRLEGAKMIIVRPEPENKASRAALASCGFEFVGQCEYYRYLFCM